MAGVCAYPAWAGCADGGFVRLVCVGEISDNGDADAIMPRKRRDAPMLDLCAYPAWANCGRRIRAVNPLTRPPQTAKRGLRR